jgi:hypothetical protein
MPNVDRPGMRGTTHWDGCWREHHACAVARVERLEKELAEAKARRCENCKHWRRRPGKDYGECDFWSRSGGSGWFAFEDECCRNLKPKPVAEQGEQEDS